MIVKPQPTPARTPRTKEQKEAIRARLTVPRKKPPRVVNSTKLELAELRFKAMQVFVALPSRTPIAAMLELPDFKGLDEQQLERWKDTDKWHEKREVFQKAAYAQFVTKAADRITAMYMDAVEHIEPIQSRLEAELGSVTFQDSQPLKLVQTYLRVLEVKTKLAADAARLLTPRPTDNPPTQVIPDADVSGAGSHEGPHEEEQPVTDEEARAAALAIIHVRRKNAEKKLAASQAAAPEAAGSD